MNLKDTRWLAEKLDLSVKSIERLRSDKPESLPPFIKIGHSYRYCEAQVDAWLANNQSSTKEEIQK